MSLLTEFIIFAISIAILIKGSDFFVTSASKIAKTFGISEFIIGLTIVAIGTSLPELAVSISAALKGSTELVIGNIIGSNIANIGLVLGIAAMMAKLTIRKETFYRDGIILIAFSLLFLLFSLDRKISGGEGVIFLILFAVYIYHLIKSRPKESFGYERYVAYLWKLIKPTTYTNVLDKGLDLHTYASVINNAFGVDHPIKVKRVMINFITLIIGAIGIFIGAKFLIPSATNIALALNVSETIVGVVMIAIGTSLPELFVSLVAAHKGYGNILLGNLFGSNIANLLLIGGIASLITPLVIEPLAIFFLIPFMLLMTIMLLLFIKANWLLRKFEGAALLIMYIIFIAMLVVFG